MCSSGLQRLQKTEMTVAEAKQIIDRFMKKEVK